MPRLQKRLTMVEQGSWRRWLKEPLPWFMLAGMVIFLANGWWTRTTDDTKVIRLTTGKVRELADSWQVQMGKPPSADELQSLMDDYLHEEVLYREARRIGLETDDTIIRRRLAQKMSFVIDDTLEIDAPSDEALSRYYQENITRYRAPTTFTFHHVYLRDLGADSRVRALTVLGKLRAGTDPSSVGDPFMLRRTYAEQPGDELVRLFGEEFVKELGELPVGDDWQGPIESLYGFHLVQLQARIDEHVPPLAEIRDQVLQDYMTDERRKANAAAFEKLRANYRIVLPGENNP